jgi:hypothetical protein
METLMQNGPPPNRNLVDWLLVKVASSLHNQQFPPEEIGGVLADKERKYEVMTTSQLSGNVLQELGDREFYSA